MTTLDPFNRSLSCRCGPPAACAGGLGAARSADAQMQRLAAVGGVARTRASSIIRRIVRAQRPHSALHPKHR